jgi:hypothetical protein
LIKECINVYKSLDVLSCALKKKNILATFYGIFYGAKSYDFCLLLGPKKSVHLNKTAVKLGCLKMKIERNFFFIACISVQQKAGIMNDGSATVVHTTHRFFF